MNHPVKFKHIMVLTGEPSGDLHAGHLIKEIKKSSSRIDIIADGNLWKDGLRIYSVESIGLSIQECPQEAE